MPIRIRDRSTTDTIAPSRNKVRAPMQKAAAAPPAFSEQLLTATRSLAQQDLDRLYLDVEEQGRRLMEQPTPAELGRYKATVKTFVEYVIKNGLKLKSSLSARELHQIVDRVDEELLGLADALLAKEQHVMDLGAKIDQINGMMLDLKA